MNELLKKMESYGFKDPLGHELKWCSEWIQLKYYILLWEHIRDETEEIKKNGGNLKHDSLESETPLTKEDIISLGWNTTEKDFEFHLKGDLYLQFFAEHKKTIYTVSMPSGSSIRIYEKGKSKGSYSREFFVGRIKSKQELKTLMNQI